MSKELYKAFEEATTKNVKAVMELSERAIIQCQAQQQEVRRLQAEVVVLKAEIDNLKSMIVAAMSKGARGGTS
jgi:cell division protein FtsB